ncbi:hypothetical protein D3C80_1972490 [compost metagenome]
MFIKVGSLNIQKQTQNNLLKIDYQLVIQIKMFNRKNECLSVKRSYLALVKP